MYWNLSRKFIMELCTLLYFVMANQGLNHFRFHKRRNFYRQQAENILPYLTTFLWTIRQKNRIHWYNELLNIFLNRCSYKKSVFVELVYNSSVPLLMICSFKSFLKGLALDFFLLLWGLTVSICIAYLLSLQRLAYSLSVKKLKVNFINNTI